MKPHLKKLKYGWSLYESIESCRRGERSFIMMAPTFKEAYHEYIGFLKAQELIKSPVSVI